MEKIVEPSWFSALPEGAHVALPFSALKPYNRGLFVEDKYHPQPKHRAFFCIKADNKLMALTSPSVIKEFVADSDDDEEMCNEKELFFPFFLSMIFSV